MAEDDDDPFDPLAVLQRVRAELGRPVQRAGPKGNGRGAEHAAGTAAQSSWRAPELGDAIVNGKNEHEDQLQLHDASFSHRLEKLPEDLVERPVGPATLLSIAELQMQLAHAHARLAEQEVRIADLHEENRTMQTKLHTHLSERSRWRIERRELESALREAHAQVSELRASASASPRSEASSCATSAVHARPSTPLRSRSPSPSRSSAAPRSHASLRQVTVYPVAHQQRRRPSTAGSGSRRRVSTHSAMTSPLDWASAEINTLHSNSYAPSLRPRRRSGFAAMASSSRTLVSGPRTAQEPSAASVVSDKSMGASASSHGSEQFSQHSRTADHFSMETFSDHFRANTLSRSSTPSLSLAEARELAATAATVPALGRMPPNGLSSDTPSPPPPPPPPPSASPSLSQTQVSTGPSTASSTRRSTTPVAPPDQTHASHERKQHTSSRDISSEPSAQQFKVKRPFIGTVRRGSLFRDSVFHVENDHSAKQRKEAAQHREREQRHTRAGSLSSFASAGTWHRRGLGNGDGTEGTDPSSQQVAAADLYAFQEESSSVENGARRPRTAERGSRKSSHVGSTKSSVRTSVEL